MFFLFFFVIVVFLLLQIKSAENRVFVGLQFCICSNGADRGVSHCTLTLVGMVKGTTQQLVRGVVDA